MTLSLTLQMLRAIVLVLFLGTGSCYKPNPADQWWKEQSQALFEAKLAYNNEVFTKPSTHATNPIDVSALEDLYRSTAGPTWVHNSGWLSGDPCQSMWYGVACSESGDVIEINLANNGLAGELTNTISEMKSLKVLKLNNNAIGGIIPQTLFSMQSLTVIDLDYNKLGGTLPSEISMLSLKNFSVANNQLEGYLPSTWASSSIETISLGSNMFQGLLPIGLSTLTSLKYLDLSQNYFTGQFPPEYSRLVSLETLWLFTNHFSDPVIPESWNALTHMKNFQADKLAGNLPELIGKYWSDLEVLVIVNGNLTGNIPTSFCYLVNLQYLHIFRNYVTGPIPDCFCEKPLPLVSINLSYNQITGTIPDCFQKDLVYFYMENNNLTGNLPVSLGNCPKLYTIDLSNNALTGSIPSIYDNLKYTMNWFELDNNKLHLIDDGLEDFFKAINKNFCSMNGNPWSCPLPSYFYNTTYCDVRCSKCNSLENHKSCKNCLSSHEGCGWCSEGPNCMEGYTNGPYYPYTCNSNNWVYGNDTNLC